MFSCELCEISKNTVFKEHLLTTASWALLISIWLIKESLQLLSVAFYQNGVTFLNSFYEWLIYFC